MSVCVRLWGSLNIDEEKKNHWQLLIRDPFIIIIIRTELDIYALDLI